MGNFLNFFKEMFKCNQIAEDFNKVCDDCNILVEDVKHIFTDFSGRKQCRKCSVKGSNTECQD